MSYHSVHYYHYCELVVPKWVTCSTMHDYYDATCSGTESLSFPPSNFERVKQASFSSKVSNFVGTT